MIIFREKMTRWSRKSLFREKPNFSDNRDNREAIIAISRFTLGPSTALCSLYGPLRPLQSNPSTTLCPPPRYSVLSKALCPLYNPLPPLQPSVPSMAFCSLYGPLKTAKLPLLFREMFYKKQFAKTPRIVAIYFVLAIIAMIAIITIITQAKYSAIIAK